MIQQTLYVNRCTDEFCSSTVNSLFIQGNSKVPPEFLYSAAQQPRQTQQKGAYQQVENLSKFFFCVLGAVAYLQVSWLGGSRDETWRGQGIRKRSVPWNLPKLPNLTSATSPHVEISCTCKVGQKLGVSLPLSTCSPSA